MSSLFASLDMSNNFDSEGDPTQNSSGFSGETIGAVSLSNSLNGQNSVQPGSIRISNSAGIPL